jgi:hypothetical protein
MVMNLGTERVIPTKSYAENVKIRKKEIGIPRHPQTG